MMETFLLGIKVFAFVFAILVLIRDCYNFSKVLALKEGKYETTVKGQVLLASSISYIVTMLIIGF